MNAYAPSQIPAACSCGSCGCFGHSSGSAAASMEGAALSTDGRQTLGTAESSGDGNLDAVVVGTSSKWGIGMMGVGTTVTYSFMTSLPSYHGSDPTFSVFNAAMETAARSALAAWSAVANISFVEVSDAGAGGQIRFGANSQSGSSGYAYYPSTNEIGGDVLIANNFSYNLNPTAGSYGYLTMLHEVGHALGLKHPGNYSAGSEGPFLPGSIDNTDTTVMSYYDGTATYASNLGWLDVIAVRYLYGTSSAGSIGNVTWGGDGAETFTGDSGINYFIGNGGSDLFLLGAGNDGVMAGNGEDTLSGGAGSDLLYGNIGTDLVLAGDGDDTIYGGQNGGATQTYGSGTTLAYREGSDTISGGQGADMIYGNHGGDFLVGGAGADKIFGGQDNDSIFGNDGNDTIYGNIGNDVLSGGDGYDRFYFTGNSGNDTITDFTYLVDYVAVQSNVNGSGIGSAADVIARASQIGADVVIDLGAGNTVTLSNYSATSLNSLDIFVF
ncbi:matrixin family metalloprotease [Thalassobaculum sp. OXR-137]|uniref:matrixin family metalloprotease n=1 Tax=Thalassobaculum sp. OXR-137 TaxID=3100173 RepID=UPI002AC8D97C|nr:matrixin family metalloprotease [Thalassobaculum sp. OXR-137]WPZ32807.1 matrixin family metalloprotease [Thalassobaculum sp. OXR-137]